MSTIDETLANLEKGDAVRIRWKPLIRIYGRDTFISQYGCRLPKGIIVNRVVMDIFDIKFSSRRYVPFSRLEALEKLEPTVSYVKEGTSKSDLTIQA